MEKYRVLLNDGMRVEQLEWHNDVGPANDVSGKSRIRGPAEAVPPFSLPTCTRECVFKQMYCAMDLDSAEPNVLHRPLVYNHAVVDFIIIDRELKFVNLLQVTEQKTKLFHEGTLLKVLEHLEMSAGKDYSEYKLRLICIFPQSEKACKGIGFVLTDGSTVSLEEWKRRDPQNKVASRLCTVIARALLFPRAEAFAMNPSAPKSKSAANGTGKSTREKPKTPRSKSPGKAINGNNTV